MEDLWLRNHPAAGSCGFDDESNLFLFDEDGSCGTCCGRGFRETFLDDEDEYEEEGTLARVLKACCCPARSGMRAVEACCCAGRGWRGACGRERARPMMAVVFSPVGGAEKWMRDNCDLVEEVEMAGKGGGKQQQVAGGECFGLDNAGRWGL